MSVRVTVTFEDWEAWRQEQTFYWRGWDRAEIGKRATKHFPENRWPRHLCIGQQAASYAPSAPICLDRVPAWQVLAGFAPGGWRYEEEYPF